jgi:hypothetical protein
MVNTVIPPQETNAGLCQRSEMEKRFRDQRINCLLLVDFEIRFAVLYRSPGTMRGAAG